MKLLIKIFDAPIVYLQTEQAKLKISDTYVKLLREKKSDIYFTFIIQCHTIVS